MDRRNSATGRLLSGRRGGLGIDNLGRVECWTSFRGWWTILWSPSRSKSSLDLKDDRQRASLARHIAALANHGGGVVVFGFNDDFSPCDPSSVLPLDRDTVSSIVKKYLEPAFQCDVRLVRSGRGQDHSVIVVSPHGRRRYAPRQAVPRIAARLSALSKVLITSVRWALRARRFHPRQSGRP
ncbi:AlbA family DNA-binding domain-containing protein [Rhizobium leguminosarum]|uniref:AlbA family DNA-binding domain-containing protein n=1 Tax=Rhizobium leguminosarum TaxID=384 RepID=UPI003D159753